MKLFENFRGFKEMRKSLDVIEMSQLIYELIPFEVGSTRKVINDATS